MTLTPVAPAMASAGELAGEDDGRCAHHPTKKAATVCAGTGDYICELCRIDLGGESYSVQYLDGGGREVVERRLTRTLPRPERQVMLCLLASLSCIATFLAPVFCVYGWVQVVRLFRLQRESPLYREVAPRGAGVVAVLAMLGVTAIAALIVVSLAATFIRSGAGAF